MDQVIAIFQKLGADGTVWYQLAIFVAFFFILKFTLLGKLQEVIELREEKTTKLDGNADASLLKASQMEQEYKDSIEGAYVEASEILNEKKAEVAAENSKVLGDARAKYDVVYQDARTKFVSEIEEQKTKVLSSADELSKELVDRLI